jgi:hypothetical protein
MFRVDGFGNLDDDFRGGTCNSVSYYQYERSTETCGVHTTFIHGLTIRYKLDIKMTTIAKLSIQ